MEPTKRFIGPNEVLFVTDLVDEKTPLGNDMVLVNFGDGKDKKLPKMIFNCLVTDAPINLEELRQRWVDPVVNQTIVLLQEADIVMDDMVYFNQTLLNSIDYKSERAIAKLYGVDFYSQRSLLQIEKVLNENTNTTSDTKPE